ncbi:MAG TPA: hypothetical protein DD713_06450 [Nitrospiraceae bacterium]|nr:hypothetical protein [Nitrospiraceae bacterium]
MGSILNKKVKEVMHHGVITVTRDASEKDICKIMSDNHVSCVAVNNENKEIVGIVSGTDILKCIVECKGQACPFKAGDRMTKNPISVDVDDDLKQAIDVLSKKRIHRVLVASKGNPVGILSATDIVNEIGKTSEEKPEMLYSRLEKFEKEIKNLEALEIGKRKVSAVMTPGVMMIPMTISVRETAKIISDKKIHRIIVVTDEGEMIGVISAMDILKPFAEEFADTPTDRGILEHRRVIAGDIMTGKIEWIEHWRTFGEAVEKMASKNIHALLVLFTRGEIDEMKDRPIMTRGVVQGVNIPIGFLSVSDIVREIALKNNHSL